MRLTNTGSIVGHSSLGGRQIATHDVAFVRRQPTISNQQWPTWFIKPLAAQAFARKRHKPKVTGFRRGYDWQKQSGKVTLMANEGIEECLPSS
jgi:hypothetical protein